MSSIVVANDQSWDRVQQLRVRDASSSSLQRFSKKIKKIKKIKNIKNVKNKNKKHVHVHVHQYLVALRNDFVILK